MPLPKGVHLEDVKATFVDGVLEVSVPLPAKPEATARKVEIEEPKNAGLLRDALYELTGRKLVVAFAEGAVSADPHADEPTAPSEDELYELMKETFDAKDVEDQ